jgi:hypothetical protein
VTFSYIGAVEVEEKEIFYFVTILFNYVNKREEVTLAGESQPTCGQFPLVSRRK